MCSRGPAALAADVEKIPESTILWIRVGDIPRQTAFAADRRQSDRPDADHDAPLAGGTPSDLPPSMRTAVPVTIIDASLTR